MFNPSVLICLVCVLACFSSNGCKSVTAPKPVDSGKVTLKTTEVTCTEAWLSLHAENMTLPATIYMTVDRDTAATLMLSSNDTTVYIDSLRPSRNYVVQALFSSAGVQHDSDKVTFKTMDTTSHNFTWQTFIYGGPAGSSGFNDVAIISDTSIWVVGEYGKYNAAHWNGREWKFFAFQFYYFQGQPDTYSFPLEAVYAFGEKKIIVSVASQLAYINGEEQIKTDFIPVSAKRIWAKDTSDIYIVGGYGRIAHYDGRNWAGIASRTTLDMQDVWGITDPLTGEDKVLCIASNIFSSDGNLVLKLSNNHADVISNKGLSWYYHRSLWFHSTAQLYLVGSGVYKSIGGINVSEWEEIKPVVAPYYSFQIRGNDANDIFICGSFGDMTHFNGVTWKDYLGTDLQSFNGNFYSLAMKGNTVCAVGGIDNKGIILLGKRN